MRMTASIIFLSLASSLPLRADVAERARYLMGSPCTITAAHAETGAAAGLIEQAFGEMARWERILSDYTDASELSRVNSAAAFGPVEISPDLLGFLEGSLALAAETGGAFDPTVGPLVDLYALRRGGRWPAPEEVEVVRRRVGYELLRVDPGTGTARFSVPGMRLDPGAVGKGIALDAAGDLLEAGGVRWALLQFGRQVLAVGDGADRCGFPVEIAASGPLPDPPTTLFLQDASAATSANSERGLVVDGRPLGHVVDPRSGLPASGARTVTVIAPHAARADALSTALMVMGPEEGLKAARRLGVEALFVVESGARVHLLSTDGFHEMTRRSCTEPPPAAPPPVEPLSSQGC
jgi:thiamine biosynthesis lipoprotein